MHGAKRGKSGDGIKGLPIAIGARHSVRVPRVHADSTAVHLADHRNLRCKR